MTDTLRSTMKHSLRAFVLPVAVTWLSAMLPLPCSTARAEPQPAPAGDPSASAPPMAQANPAPVPGMGASSQPASAMPASRQAAQTKPEPTTLPEVRKYCTNIATAATEARFAWQTTKLNELETRIRAKIKDLDAKEAEFRDWMDKRDAIQKQASEKLVGIYSKMKPETAASQISALDDDMAAAVLSQLGPRQASAIFNEIVPDRAAKLAGLIASATPPDKKL